MAEEEITGIGEVKLDLCVEENEGLYGVAACFEFGNYKGECFIGAMVAQEIGQKLIEAGKAAKKMNEDLKTIN